MDLVKNQQSKFSEKNIFLQNRKLKVAAKIINNKNTGDVRSPTKRKISNVTKKMNNKKTKTTVEADFVVLDGNETKDELKIKIIEANNEISTLKKALKEEKSKSFEWELMYLKTFGKVVDLESHNFDYKSFKNSKSFDYLCGLSFIEFNVIMECLQPLSILIY